MNLLTRLFGRRRLFDDLAEEIRQHLEQRTDELVAQGMSRDEAAAAARRSFGNVDALEERGRDVWRWPLIEDFLFDVLYALRQLRRQPVFTAVAVSLLAVGIGANTAVYSLIDQLILEPLPFRSPERIVAIINQDSPSLSNRTSTVATYEALERMQTLEDSTYYEAFFERGSFKLTGDGQPARVTGVMVPGSFFSFLGVAPLLGRTFTEEEVQPNGPSAVLLSHRLWQRRFSSDPDIVGRRLEVNDRAATIVGVMPPEFDFGSVFSPGTDIGVFVPAVADVIRNWGNTISILGRLKPGVTMEAAQLDANAVIERQKAERPDLGRVYAGIVRPLDQTIRGTVRQPLLTMWAGVVLVLLIVSVNLSNILLARASTRQRELAVRGALGAGRTRLLRQLITESFALSAIGGGCGVVLAYGAVAVARNLDGLSVPLLKTVEIDAGALGAASAITAATAVLFGLAPAVAGTRRDVFGVLKGNGATGASDAGRLPLRSTLVVAQVALACVLLVGAGLLLRSFLRVLDVELGFETERTYALRIDPGGDIDIEQEYVAYIGAILSTARTVPGVESAAITDAVPFGSNRSWAVSDESAATDPEWVGALVKAVSPGLFETMRTPLIAGRDFDDDDDGGSPPVVIVNRTLAERLWPGQDPLRQSLRFFNRSTRQVVGVVADVRHLTVEESSGPEFYVPLIQMISTSPSLVIRSERPIAEVAPRLRSALTEIVPGLPTEGLLPLQEFVDRAVSSRRFFMSILTAFAGVAIVLAAVGIYGVISFTVTRRTREIGIRIAIGAPSGRIRRGIVHETLRLALVGSAIGFPAAIVAAYYMSSLLYDISPGDPWTYAGAGSILLLVSGAASFLPAARASRISPTTALRAD